MSSSSADLIGLLDNAASFIERIASKSGWKWRATLVMVIVSLGLHFPAYNYLAGHISGTEPNARWSRVQEQRANLLTHIPQPHNVQQNKTTFRLTVPFLAWILHLDTLGVYVLQFALGVAILWLALHFAFKHTRDPVVAILFTGILLSSYPGSAGFVDIWGHRDAFSYFFLLAGLVATRPWLIFICAFFAAFNDERGFLATGVLWVFHVHEAKKRASGRIWTNSASVAVILAWLAYAIGRYALIELRGFELGTGGVGMEVFQSNLDLLLWGVWSGLRAGWLLVLLFFFVLFRDRQYVIAAGYLLAAMGILGATLMVDDMTRSIGYAFTLFFPALLLLHNGLPRPAMRILLFFTFVFALMEPSYQYMGGGRIFPIDPVFMKAINLVVVKLGLG